MNRQRLVRCERNYILLAVGVAAAIVLCAALLVFLAHRAGIAPFALLRDPSDHFGFPVYAGLISNLGVSVLTMAASVAGFAALFGRRNRARLAAAALLSAALAIDDQYMLHEYVGPKFLGVPELAFLGLYLALGLGIAWSIGSRLVLLRHATLLIAGFGLALSVAIDLVLPMNAYTVLAEDLAKLGGFIVWLFYWIAAAARAMGAAGEVDARS